MRTSERPGKIINVENLKWLLSRYERRRYSQHGSSKVWGTGISIPFRAIDRADKCRSGAARQLSLERAASVKIKWKIKCS